MTWVIDANGFARWEPEGCGGHDTGSDYYHLGKPFDIKVHESHLPMGKESEVSLHKDDAQMCLVINGIVVSTWSLNDIPTDAASQLKSSFEKPK